MAKILSEERVLEYSKEFKVKVVQLTEMEGIIIGEDLDITARKESDETYTFFDDPCPSGCYLIFDRIEPKLGESINPIYAGRSNDLSKRLSKVNC